MCWTEHAQALHSCAEGQSPHYPSKHNNYFASASQNQHLAQLDFQDDQAEPESGCDEDGSHTAASAAPASDPGPGSTVVPRRRCGARPKPVVVTHAIVRKLQTLPVHRAADVIGISATALKRACRRLGIHRWPYHRGGGGAAAVNTPPSPATDSTPTAPTTPAEFLSRSAGRTGPAADDSGVDTAGTPPPLDEDDFAGLGPEPSSAAAPPCALCQWMDLPSDASPEVFAGERGGGGGDDDGDGGGVLGVGLGLFPLAWDGPDVPNDLRLALGPAGAGGGDGCGYLEF
jgi:hypothetical protein